MRCVISSFITKPQLESTYKAWLESCVISSFITKPQPTRELAKLASCCVISSFITKPQLSYWSVFCKTVALYPLSSPNHNLFTSSFASFSVALYPLSSPSQNVHYFVGCFGTVALYPLSSPNHNCFYSRDGKPSVALYPLSSPNHNPVRCCWRRAFVALYPLSSPNHNSCGTREIWIMLRYILFHHQTTTGSAPPLKPSGCVISSFITKPQPVFLMCCNIIQLQGVYSTGNGMVSSLSMAKLLKKLKLNRLLLYFLFYLSPYIDDVGVLFVGYRDYTKSSLAGHEEFYPLDVYIP